MKKILSKCLIVTMICLNLFTYMSFAIESEVYIGDWTCEVTNFKPLDLGDLRSQMEALMGSKIPDEQWGQMSQTLELAMNSNIKDVKRETFTLDIYDDINKGLSLDLINSSGQISNSTATSEVSGGLSFDMNRFINEYVAADTSMFIKSTDGKNLIGQTTINQRINSNGLELNLKSIVDFKGVKRDSAIHDEEEIIYIEEIEITSTSGAEISNIELQVGEKINLNYRVYPSDYSKDEIKRLEWYSNDSAISSVTKSGSVTALSIGQTQIAVWINGDFDLSDTVTINVIEKDDGEEANNKSDTSDSNSSSDSSGGTDDTSQALETNTSDEENDSEDEKDNSSNTNTNTNTDTNTDTDNDEDKDNDKDKVKDDKRNKTSTVDKVEDAVTDFADIISKATDFLPSPDTMSKVPLLDIFVFGYECDKDSRENMELGDEKDYADKKSFWANVIGLGPIGMIPKAADLVLEVSKKIGFDFDFSFEQTLKGANNFAFDMFSDDSRANIDDMKKRHKENHYGVVGGFGVWVSSTIHDFSNRGQELNNEIENN